MTPQITMSTRFTLYLIAAARGTMKPRIAPERLNDAAMLPARMSAISAHGVTRM